MTLQPHCRWVRLTSVTLLALTVLALADNASAQFENCPNLRGDDCTVATPGIPGCLDEACCNAVCEVDPGCCLIEWDEICVAIGKDVCGVDVCGPGNGDCFSENGTPGCEIEECCEDVCAIDPGCCGGDWDDCCVGAAAIICGLCAPEDAPINDDCVNAIEAFDGVTPFDTACASPDGPIHKGTPCSQLGWEDLGLDVWFTYIATSTGPLSVNTCGQADFTTELAVYDGCVCPFTDEDLIGCSSGAETCLAGGANVIFDAVEGNCYTIRVGGFCVLAGPGSITIEAPQEPKAPPNDECADAITVLADQPLAFNNTLATTDGFPSVACNFLNQAQIELDIWYDFTPDVSATYEVSLCETFFDTKLAVYQGCACPTPVEPIACNDDFCDAQSRVSFDAFVGQCYKIRVGSFPNDPGGPGEVLVTQISEELCPSGGNTELTHSLSNSIADGAGVACSDGPFTLDNAWARTYDLGILVPGEVFTINCVMWGIEENLLADVTADVNVYEDTDGGEPTAPGVDLVLLGSVPLFLPAGTSQQSFFVNFDPPIVVDPDTVLVVELAVPDLAGITGVWVGANNDGQTSPSYIRSDGCGVPEFVDIATINCPECPDSHIVNTVIGDILIECPWDLDGDGNVGTGDLIVLLGAWGDPYGTSDLIELLGNWGPCEG